MSNTHMVLMLGFIPMRSLPYGLAEDFWISHPKREQFADDLRSTASRGEITIEKNTDERLVRLVSHKETGSFIHVTEMYGHEYEPGDEDETGDYSVFFNGEPVVSLVSKDEAETEVIRLLESDPGLDVDDLVEHAV